MSDYTECTECGAEIEETGVQYRGLSFCSDDCCEEYEQKQLDSDEPDLEDLDDEEDDLENLDEDLGYRGDDDEEDDYMNDDYDIKPEDF
ncbi:MAG: hypothetical protein GY780_13905 [bacterium]|nr:hypothetical protein [bacterium]